MTAFFTIENLSNVSWSLIPLFILAAGQTLVLITGGIDLSMTAVLALSSVAGAAAMRSGLPWPMAVAAMIATGASVGALNGLAVAGLRLPPFMVTLITLMIFSGVAVWSTQSKPIGGLPGGFCEWGRNLVVAAGAAGVVGLGLHVLLRRGVFGRWLYATGLNATAARASGVPVGRITAAVYVMSGMLAGLASVIQTARLETGSPVLGQRQLLDVVGAAVIGGASLFGGRGGVRGALGGTTFFAVLDNALNLFGLEHFRIMVVKGAVILAAAAVDAGRRTFGSRADR